MTKYFAWLGVAMLAAMVAASPARAVPGEPLKPYVVLVLDTSGSMNEVTGSGPSSCGGADSKLNHAKCAINNIVNSYGDIVFGLGRFRMVDGGTPPSCTLSGAGAAGSATCNTSTDMFELLAALVDGTNGLSAVWTDRTLNTCTDVGTDPEIFGVAGNTPLEGTLRGSKSYWQGLQGATQTIWAPGRLGFDPIRTDPRKLNFLPKPSKPATCNANAATCDNSVGCTSATNCCCLQQCRPYIVILLTDGAETCSGTPANGAAALLATDVDNRRYRVETKPIGFGIPVGDAQIESIAHAGGAGDAPGVNEGYYASDEAGVQLAISQILAGAVRTELCNNLDDDCDSLIDEDFPNKGMACDNGRLGVCRTTGTLGCTADFSGVACNAAPGPAAGTEVCNNLDDDCDGRTDEGLTGCTCAPQGELCNNLDDDCDGVVDNGLTRACGSGTCTGTETCSAGVYGGCTAQPSTAETCNGLDDNCDGVVDGITQACSNLVSPGGPPTGNPAGVPGSGCALEGSSICICHPGQKVCPAGGGGTFGACLGEQGPLTEVCNGLDDDCDGMVDESTGGANCSSSCGVGTTQCVNGVLTCNAVAATTDNTCNGIDDDCDGLVDEDYMSPGACGVGNVCNGMEQCINGMPTCIGQPILPESCNCTDDDCDGQVDEGQLCGAGATCTNCQCAFACSPGEFPCPAGKTCSAAGFCIADACFGVSCPPVNGNAQVCVQTGNAGTCVDRCSQTTCPAGEVCVGATGECKPDDCTTFPDRCSATENCVAGTCVNNPCQGVTCGTEQYCVGGACIDSCAGVDCPANQRCRLGVCESNPCGHACPFGQACNDTSGECVADPCTAVVCPTGEYCDANHNGACIPDPCVGTACPAGTGEVCIGGTCYDPQSLQPDAGAAQIITTGGGGGCDAGGNAGGPGVLSGLLVGLAALATRKRRATRAIGGRS